MKSIYQLVPDVQEILTKKDGWFSTEISKEFAHETSSRLWTSFNKEESKPSLRLSQMGARCPKALWHSIHTPAEAEALPPWAELKYAFGHVVEALAISLAKASGHRVEGEQDHVELDGVSGHRDCVVDGCIVDVKSCSSRAFEKFKTHSIQQDDSFGYLDQLDGYVVASLSDPIVTCKDKGYILAIDKTLGHMCLYEHIVREQSIRQRISDYRRVVERSSPPDCTCETEPDGRSGNQKLGVRAAYSAFKHCCFPTLRTFLYSKRPVYLTKVERIPDVPEIDRHGKIIYR